MTPDLEVPAQVRRWHALCKREQELGRQKTHLNGILSALEDVFYVLDADGDLQRWNDRLCQATGYDDHDLESMNVVDFFTGRDTDRVTTALETVVSEGRVDVDVDLLAADGTATPFEFTAVALEEPSGNPAVAGIGRDVSDRKRLEADLETETEHFRVALENSPLVAFRLDTDLRYTWISNPHLKFQSGDVIGKRDDELLPADAAETVMAPKRRALETGRGIREEVTYETPAGTVTYDLTVEPVRDERGSVVGLTCAALDVTEQKVRERELERLETIVQAVGDPVYAVDEDGVIRFVNDAIEPLAGYDPEALIGRHVSTVAADEAVEESQELIRGLLRSDESYATFEMGFVTADGDLVEVENNLALLPAVDGGFAGTAGVIRDVTDRNERERELERTRALLEHTQRLARVGGWELDLRTEPPYRGTLTDELYRVHELPLGATMDLERGIEFYHPDDRDRVRAAVTAAIEDNEQYDLEARLITATGNRRWVRTIGKPVIDDGRVVAVRGSLQDVTAQKRHETALQSLHEATRGLLQTDTEADVADLVVDVAADVLEMPCVAIYRLDTATSEFEPVALTPEYAERYPDAPPIAIGDAESPVSTAFVSGTEEIVDERTDPDAAAAFDDGIRSSLFVPLADHGVFVAGSPEPIVDESTRQLVETLVATTVAAFDRLQSETELAARDAELTAQNERLRRQVGITELIRTVDRSLVRATTREQIETAVCDRLVDGSGIAFAWVGDVDPGSRELRPRAWGGTPPSYLDAITDDDRAPADEPAWRTARTDETAIVSNVVEGMRDEPWRRAALAAGFRSVVCIPLEFDEYSYGVLAVYASEPDAFGDLERSVFTDLGATIACSINAVETRRALHAGTVTQLELRLTGSDSFLSRLAREADCRVTYERLVADADDETQLFVSVSGAPVERIERTLDGLVSVTAWTAISESDAGNLFEVRVTGPVLAAKLVRHGGSPQSIVAEPDATTVVVDVPVERNVREFLGMLDEVFPGVELLARHDVERPMHTEQELLESILGSLSDRQRETLDAAYAGGFFEWPRESTGEEVAELLGVSQPTVNRHLRLGQKALLTALFGDR